jgi:hypothetical protein
MAPFHPGDAGASFRLAAASSLRWAASSLTTAIAGSFGRPRSRRYREPPARPAPAADDVQVVGHVAEGSDVDCIHAEPDTATPEHGRLADSGPTDFDQADPAGRRVSHRQRVPNDFPYLLQQIIRAHHGVLHQHLDELFLVRDLLCRTGEDGRVGLLRGTPGPVGRLVTEPDAGLERERGTWDCLPETADGLQCDLGVDEHPIQQLTGP